MKPTLKIWAAAWWLLLMYSQASLGQTQPAPCGDLSMLTVPTNFANWDWEVDLTQPGYCNTWTANIGNSNFTGKRFMRAPWVSAASDYVMRIGTGRDYRRANGWELIRMDFGGNLGSTPYPYFILYNRHTAVLRVFMYLTSQPYGKVLMTLRHGSSNTPNARNPAILAMANPLQAAPDKYQSQASASTDMMTYVCKYGAATGWIMAEYTMSFDPNVTNNQFYESALLFEVYGITTSNVELGGSFKFTTQPQPEDGYGFSVASSRQTTNPNGTKSFLTNGAKLLGNVGNWSDQISSLNKKAEKAVASLDRFGTSGKQPLFAAWKFSKFVQKQTESKAAGALKGIFDAAGMLGGGFSLLGSVIGTLWPDVQQAAAPVTVAPTISSGTITLTGTIETSVRLGFISLQIPGTPHNFDGATNGPARSYQPYYDCPMGLFNLTTTPRLETITYRREADMYPYSDPAGFYYVPPDYVNIEATSYGPMPLQFAYNRAAGIEVVSVKAAIMQKVPYRDLVDLEKPMAGFSRFNFVQAQVEAGALEAAPYDMGDPNTDDPTDDTFLVHTPFVDAGCFSQVAYNAYSVDLAASPVFVRVIAILRRTGADASAPPIYFVQDYAAETFPSTTTRRFPPSPYARNYVLINEPTPFGFYQGGYTPASRTVTTGTAPDFQGLNGAYYYNAPAALNFSGDFSFSFAAPSSSKTIVTAARSISISNSTLSVPVGDELVMEPTRTALLQCAPQVAIAAGPGSCTPNGWALRPANATSNALSGGEAKQLSTGIELAPNPAKGSTVVSLRGEANEYVERVEVFTMSGRQVWAAPPLTRVREVSIPLNGLPPGLYVVRVISTHRSYAQKLQVD